MSQSNKVEKKNWGTYFDNVKEKGTADMKGRQWLRPTDLLRTRPKDKKQGRPKSCLGLRCDVYFLSATYLKMRKENILLKTAMKTISLLSVKELIMNLLALHHLSVVKKSWL